MTGKIKIYDEPIAWSNEGTYKNLLKVLNKIPAGEELVQVENSVTHLHVITRALAKGKKRNCEYKIYHEPISFTLKGTYKNLKLAISKLPAGEEFLQICTTPTHLHMVTKKVKK